MYLYFFQQKRLFRKNVPFTSRGLFAYLSSLKGINITISLLNQNFDDQAFPFEEMKPTSKQVLIHAPKMPNGDFVNEAIRHPSKMDKVWESVGYREDMGNVGIFKLATDDPDNYECLGYVAREVKDNGKLEEDFDYGKYACVHKRYLKTGHKKRTLWRSSEENVNNWTLKGRFHTFFKIRLSQI